MPLSQRRDGRRIRFPLAVAEDFVKSKEESFVPADRSAYGPAELVLLQRLDGGGGIAGGIEGVISQELPKRAMKLIGTRTADDVRRGAKTIAELGAGIVRKNAELGDRVHRRLENKTTI